MAIFIWRFPSLGLTSTQTFAVGGFCVVLYGAIFFWRYRLAFACFGVALLLALGLLDVPHFIEFAGLDIIVFLVAMMTTIGFLEEQHVFEFVIDHLLRIVGPHPRRIMIVMMVMAAVSAALVDEVTSILFMVAAMLNLLKDSKLSPIPFILMLVFTTNIGSSATVVGNPVGVIIALRSGLTFLDFLRWATPISLICLLVTIPICLALFAKEIAALKEVLAGKRGEQTLEHLVEAKQVTRRGVRLSGWLFGGVVFGLVLHHPIEHLLHLPNNTMLLGIALIGAGMALAVSGDKARVLVEKRVGPRGQPFDFAQGPSPTVEGVPSHVEGSPWHPLRRPSTRLCLARDDPEQGPTARGRGPRRGVDWWTLMFFLMLFASVGTLKQTGVTGVIANRIIELSGGDIPILTTLVIANLLLLQLPLMPR